MDITNTSLRLITGLPIPVSNEVYVYKVSLKEIIDMGYTSYSSILKFMCLSREYYEEAFGLSDITTLQYLKALSLHEETAPTIISGMFLFFHADYRDGSFFINEHEITDEEFDEAQKIIKIRNGISSTEEAEDHPANDKAAELLQKRKKYREEIAKRKSDTSDIDFSDLISIYASRTNLSIDVIIQYDIYQFHNQFKRLKIYDDYETNMQALMHGAKPDDIEIKYWISKISDD